MKLYVHQASTASITVENASAERGYETFRVGPSINSRSAPLGCMTTDVAQLVEHVRRHWFSGADQKRLCELLRVKLNASKPGDEIHLDDIS